MKEKLEKIDCCFQSERNVYFEICTSHVAEGRRGSVKKGWSTLTVLYLANVICDPLILTIYSFTTKRKAIHLHSTQYISQYHILTEILLKPR